VFCRNCGKELSDKAVACMGCGMIPKDGTAHCPSCGVETKDKQVICTACGASLKSDGTDGGPPIARRFLLSFAWTLAVFILLIMSTQPRNQWVVGFIGSAMFAIIGGLVAMAIRTKHKIIFVPVSIVVSFVIAAIVGALIS